MKKYVLKTTCFVTIFICLFCGISYLFGYKQLPEIARDKDSNTGFYALEKDTVDVLYVGSSHAFTAFYPEDIFHDYGITGYVRASSMQRIWQSYTLMEESFQYQHPKIVVYEVAVSYFDVPNSEAFNREMFDNMRPSLVKYRGVKEAMNEDESLLSYVFQIIRYHDKWKELSENDFLANKYPDNMLIKGATARIAIVPAENLDNNLYSLDVLPAEMPERCYEYLYKMKQLCDKNGAELVLVKVPTLYSYFWSGANHLKMEEIADELGVKFLDYNVGEYATEIDWNTETLDGGNHLNYHGALKISKIFGQWLLDNYDWEDKRNNPAYSCWNDDYEKYKKEVNAAMLCYAGTLNQYMDLLKGTDYLVVISAKEDALNQIKEPEIQALDLIGCNIDYSNGECTKANLWGSFKGEEIVSDKGERVVSYKKEIMTHLLEFESLSLDSGNTVKICIDGEDYSPNLRGLNIVVYDLEHNKLVDASTFDYDEKGTLIKSEK